MKDDLIKAAMETKVFSFDAEHEPKAGPHHKDFTLHGMSFAANTLSGEKLVYYETNKDNIGEICNYLFMQSDVECVAFNGKYDIQCLNAAKLVSPNNYPIKLVDPMIGINLLDDNRPIYNLGLKKIVKDFFDHDMVMFEEAIKMGIDSKTFEKYTCEDASWELRLWLAIRPRLEQEKLLPVFERVLMASVPVFADMEMCGIKWDLDGALNLLKGYQEVREKMKEKITKELGPLNIDSGDQLSKRLFEELGYSTKEIERTKSGKRYSVDESAMDTLAERYPICRDIRFYRTASKMISTYVEPLTKMALADAHGRVHSTYWLVSATGRTRCEKPNLQNQPAHLDKKIFGHLSIRDNFVAEKGWSFIIADLSQIELRLVAHITCDPTFLAAYRDWQCTACKTKGESDVILHKCPTCGCAEDEHILKDKSIEGFWHGLDLHQITTDSVPALNGDRQNGKQSNFAIVYCASAYRMHYEHPELSVAEWDDIIKQWLKKYHGVKAWHHHMERLLWESGVCVDIFGRKRRITEVDVKRNPKHALNMIVNFNPQSSACELSQNCLAKLRKKWVASNDWIENIKPVNFVHDEFVSEVRDEMIDKFIPDIRDGFELNIKFKVPIRMDIKVAKKWTK